MSQSAQKVESVISNVLNGIDTTALGQAVAGISADPSLGQVTFRARTSWQGGPRSRTEIESYELAGQQIARRHIIDADEPVELLGGNTAPNPQDLLLSALAACMTVGFVAAATAEGIRIDSLDIHTECSLDLRGALGIDLSVPAGARKVKYTIEVCGSATREQFEQIHQQVTLTSPNYFHMANPIALEAELVVR